VITLEQYAKEIDRLEREILAAQASQSITAEALAYECAAEFYLEWGKEKIATVYRQDAYDCYIKAGAQAEITYLEQNYPQLRSSTLPPSQQFGGTNYFTDEFVATVSHEFRNPLNGILGMSEALLEGVFGTLNERQLNAIQTVDRSGEYLLALIDNMAALSQIQAGKLELELTSVSVTELCQSSVSFVEHNAIQKKIHLDLNIPIDLSSIYIDFQRMRQVLINLLNHAIDSTPVGGNVELVVTQVGDMTIANSIANEIASIQFAIIDTSKEISPIDPSNCDAHFSSSQDRHVGLGLMLVQPIVALHGGNLSCQSIGKGNCFQVSLPHNLDNFDVTMDGSSYYTNSTEDRSDISDIIVEEISGITEVSTSSPLILIVEDNALNVNTIKSYLTAKGYRSIVANDGQAAIDLTQQHHPDLILMDIQMPGMDGLEAIVKIRQNDQLVAIPIIALTALAMDGDRSKCLKAGANDYLTKPVKLKQLHTTIQQLLATKVDDLELDINSDLWS
jgi:signal transduction histidine kinase/ActR/RegA family two-component response regulator